MYTPENITHLQHNEIFVFGSNTQGIHGAGAARIAVDRYGAIYGQAEGLQGNSYAIVTKDLTKWNRSVSLDYIKKQIEELYQYAFESTKLTFYVTKIGCGLGGFEIKEIAHLFMSIPIKPSNVILPKEFSKI